MSYIERGIYDYFKKSLTDGMRVLLSRRFLLFTLLMAIVGVFTTALTAGVMTGVVTGFDPDLIQLILYIEASLALAFILTGLINRLLTKFLIKAFIVFFFWIIFSLIGVLTMNTPELMDMISEAVALLCLFSWSIFIPLSTVWASQGLFYSKITGSILFLGKPEDNHNTKTGSENTSNNIFVSEYQVPDFHIVRSSPVNKNKNSNHR